MVEKEEQGIKLEEKDNVLNVRVQRHRGRKAGDEKKEKEKE